MTFSSHLTEIQNLQHVLHEEIALYETLEIRLLEKKEIIIHNNLDALMKLDDELEKISQKAYELQSNRLSTLSQLGFEKVTLKNFIDKLSHSEEKTKLSNARACMLKHLKNIEQLSKANENLLRSSIHLIEQSINHIAALFAPKGASYGSTQVKQGKGVNIPKENRFTSTIIREA